MPTLSIKRSFSPSDYQGALVLDGNELTIAAWRETMPDLLIPTLGGARMLLVIGHANNLRPALQNALLKTLEEPPPHLDIILQAPSLSGLLPTVISRCQVTYEKEKNDLGSEPAILQQIREHCQTPKDDEKWYATAIKLQNQLPTDREELTTILEENIQYIQQNSHLDQTGLWRQKILAALDSLRANVNTKLAIEKVLYNHKRIEEQT